MAPAPAGAETTMNTGAQLQTLLIVIKVLNGERLPRPQTLYTVQKRDKKKQKNKKTKKTRKQQKINIDHFRILTDDVRSPSRP